MLGLGLSLRSPRLISADGGTPPLAEAQDLYIPGQPGPSTNDIASTEVFHTEVIDLGGGKQRVHIYEFFIPDLPTGAYPAALGGLSYVGLGTHLGLLDDVDAVTTANTDMDTVSNFALVSDDDLILDGVPGQTVFKEFMRYLYSYNVSDSSDLYTGIEFIQEQMLSTGYAPGTPLFRSLEDLGGGEYIYNGHQGAFSDFWIGIILEFFHPEYETYLEFLDSDDYPGNFNTQNFAGLAASTFALYYRVNTVTISESTIQDNFITLPQFGDLPPIYTLVSGDFVLSDTAGGTFTLQSGEAIFGNVPDSSPVYTVPVSINESYLEIGGVPISGVDLYPIGMHEDGTTPITSFETYLQISYTNTAGGTTTFPVAITFTNSGSTTAVVGTTIIKTFAYNGSIVITEEEFPALYSSVDNGVYGIPITVSNIFNTVPNSNAFAPSETIEDPFTGTQLYIPVYGTVIEDFLGWLTDLPGDVPGTSLSLIPATDNTYDATPPSTNPTITAYSTTLPLKGSHVSFDGAVADLSTAYATSGTDLTFIAVGINKNVANTTEQLIVNRKTTTEGVGIKSDATYIKLKNASIPTDTTPAGVPAQDYQSYVPFFIYLEKTSTTASEYNEFNEEVKRYSVGANDILELDRITNNFAGSLSYIAVLDKALSATERARKIEHLRATYLDLNTPNRYE